MSSENANDRAEHDVIDIEPQVIEDTPTAAPSARHFGAAKIGGLVFVVGLLGAIAGGWVYRDVLASYLPSDQLQAMQSKLDALEAASKDSQKRADAFVALTEELKAQLGAAQGAVEKSGKENATTAAQVQSNADAIASLKANLDQVTQSLDGLKAQATDGGASVDPALAARIDQLEKEVAAFKAAPAKPMNIDAANVQQAFGALKSKIDQGAPYAPEFVTLQSLLPAAAGLDVIGAESEQGLPNAQELAAELTALSAPLPKADAVTSSTSWMPDIRSYFSSLVTVKTVGASDVSAVASQALAALQTGDLQKASDTLSSASMPLPAAFNDLQDKLKRRLKLEQAVADLSAGIARLSQVKG
jgi:hypothetical protein